MRNNKLSRKRLTSEKAVKPTSPVEHFMSGINSKDSRRKTRRYSYQAYVTFPARPVLDDKGEPTETIVPEHQRVIKLDRIVLGNAKAALDVCHEQEQELRKAIAQFKDCKIVVEAIPAETISDEMFRLVNGYQSMSQIYHLGISLAVEELLKKTPKLNATEYTQEEIDNKVEEFYNTAAETLKAARKAKAMQADEQAVEQMKQLPEEERIALGVDAVQEAMNAAPVGSEHPGPEETVSG